jgi:hypothetical protein
MLKRVLATGVLAAAMTVTSAAMAASSDAAPAAGAGNCVSVLTSAFGPQQQVDDAVHTLRALAVQSGMTFGEVARALAGQNGDVASCLAYLGLR